MVEVRSCVVYFVNIFSLLQLAIKIHLLMLMLKLNGVNIHNIIIKYTTHDLPTTDSFAIYSASPRQASNARVTSSNILKYN